MDLGVLVLVAAFQALPGPPTRWTVADGLPQGTINDIVQTPEGELWIATFGGLVRFDGLRFGVVDMGTTPELPNNRFTGLDSDGAAGLWACTQNGDLVHLVDGRVQEVRVAPAGIEVIDLLRNDDGTLWVSTSSSQIFRVTHLWTELRSTGPAGYQALARVSRGGVLAAGVHGLAHFASDGTRLGEWAIEGGVTALAAAPDGRVLVGTPGAPWLWQDGRLQALETTTPLTDVTKALQWDGGERAYFGLRAGLLAADLDGIRLQLTPCDAPSQGREMRVLLRDREDNLWLGTTGQGLERRRLPAADGAIERLGDQGVTALAEDREGATVAAYGCSGLLRFPGGEGPGEPWPVRFSDTDSRPCIQSLVLDGAGRLWLGAANRLVRAGSDGWDPPAVECELDGRVMALLSDGDEGVLALTEIGTLWRIGGAGDERERLDLGARAVSLARGADGALWIGGEGRLWRLADSDVRVWDDRAGLPRGEVRAMLVDDDGTLWLATYGGGLVRFHDERARVWTTAQGLPDNACSGLTDDGRGSLWVLCNRGVAVVSRAELSATGQSESARLTPILLGEESGFAEGNAGAPASCRSSSGELWFGTIAGAIRVHTAGFPFRTRAPVARIERLLADDVALELGRELRVPALTRRVAFEYTAFALSVPERVAFRVQLEPFEEAWSEPGTERVTSYTSLAPGAYTFRVSARNEQGIWSERPTEVRLVVLSAWWQRTPVRALAMLAVVAALALAYRARIGLLQRRTRVVLDAVEARNRAEQGQSRLRDELAHFSRVATTEGLAASLAHEVNQPLAAVTTNAAAAQRLLERDAIDTVELREILAEIASEGRRASEVVRGLRDFLGKRASQRLPLSPDHLVRETLPLVQREFDEHGVRLEMQLEGRNARVLGDRAQLQQVLVNLLQNACEAFEPEQLERRVRVNSHAQDGRFVIGVSDNGPGLAPDVARDLFRSFVTTKPKGMGIGLSISSTIAEAHGGRLHALAELGGGTRFELDLPLIEEPT